jgi:hypothetical protein
MTIQELLAAIPPQAHPGNFLTGYVKGVFMQHHGYLKVAADKGNPLQADAVEWLMDTQQLANDILENELDIDQVTHNYCSLLRRLNVPREAVILRAQGRLK